MRHGVLAWALILALAGDRVDAADCTHPSAARPYAGPLFDAMAQVDAGPSGLVLRSMDDAGVARMALFARLNPKRNGEPDVLALGERHPDRFVLGTPKRFDLHGDLPDDFIDATLLDLKKRPYRFIGEILFVHADKRHGEQTAGRAPCRCGWQERLSPDGGAWRSGRAGDDPLGGL